MSNPQPGGPVIRTFQLPPPHLKRCERTPAVEGGTMGEKLPRILPKVAKTGTLISEIYFVKKLYMFWALPLSIIRSFPLYIQHWYMSCRLDDSFQAWLVMLESCHLTCMTYTSAECTVENSWWWTGKVPETCRVSWQNKFGKLVCLLVLLERNLLQCMVTWTCNYLYSLSF